MHLHIVKMGGKVLDNPDLLEPMLLAFSELEGNKILVHGGGKKASELLPKLGISPIMVEGRRVTDSATLEVVTMVYAGLLNKQLVASLQALNCNAIGLSGADGNLIEAKKRPVKDIDYGFAGDLVTNSINITFLDLLLLKGYCPVICPITHDKKSQLLNTNADTIASVTATAMSVNYEVTLTYCFEFAGVMEDPEKPESVIPFIDQNKYQFLKNRGIIKDGMIPKMDNAFSALQDGVSEVRITKADSLGTGKGTLIKL